MGAKDKNEKEIFLEENHLVELFDKAVKIDNELWYNLQSIGQNFDSYSKNYDAIAQKLLLDIIGEDGMKGIHSARYRVKDKNSLLVKIVKKKAQLSQHESNYYEKEKYRNIDQNNYYKVMTDLIGLRILIRYREQWLLVHNWIKDKFYKGDEKFVKNFINDYNPRPDTPFIAEKPKVYYRNRTDLSFYEQIGRDFFDFIESKEGYNSIHYIVNIDGKYVEIQVRTIFDEAWSECTHDLVYKNKDKRLKAELDYLSICLSHQTIAAEDIANLMYEKVNAESSLFGSIDEITDIPPLHKKTVDEQQPKLSSIEKRIEKLKNYDINFNGNINDLI